MPGSSDIFKLLTLIAVIVIIPYGVKILAEAESKPKDTKDDEKNKKQIKQDQTVKPAIAPKPDIKPQVEVKLKKNETVTATTVAKTDVKPVAPPPVAVAKKPLSKIDFSGKGLSSVEKVLAELLKSHTIKGLEEVRLNGNTLHSIPKEILDQFQTVKVLDLSRNAFSQIPPFQISDNTTYALTSLDLSHNKLQTLPDEIGLLESIEHLDLSSNQLYQIPASIGELRKLKYFNVSHNHLRWFSCLGLGKNVDLFVKDMGFFVTDNPWDQPFKELFTQSLYRTQSISSPVSPTSPSKPVKLSKKRPLSTMISAPAVDYDLTSRPASSPAGFSVPTKQGLIYVLNYLRDLYDLTTFEEMPLSHTQEALPISHPSNTAQVPNMTYSTIRKSKMQSKREKIMNEIVQTETAYVEFLQTVHDLYMEPLKQLLSQDDFRGVFSNLDAILSMHRDVFLPAFKESSSNQAMSIGTVIVKHSPYLKLYTQYVNNYDSAIQVITKLTSQKPFKKFCKEVQKDPRHTQPSLQFYLIMPVQRIPRYRMLLEDLVGNTLPPAPEFQVLNEAVDSIQKRAIEINESKRDQERRDLLAATQKRIKGSNIVAPHRSLVKEGQLTVKKVVTVTNEKNQMKLTVEELQKQFSVLLFNDMLLVCHEANKDNHQLEIDYCLSLNTKIDPCTLISDQNEASSGDSDRSSSSLSVADSSGSFNTSSVSSEIRDQV
ncbi:hypothetical protein MP638_007061 [Amoeboaphelidium occidentale]|nr:hypothetical protein MP638_007061 [Amoeboaphelidium occidentale]